MQTRQVFSGFTLAELLIALGILGVIATFTIPKVLFAQQTGSYNAKAKETISMISGAFQAYKLQNTVDENTGIEDLTPYLNYVSLVPGGSQLDATPGGGATLKNCNNTFAGTFPCLVLHNGVTMRYRAVNGQFGTSGATPGHRVIWFEIDPNGHQVNNSPQEMTANFYLTQNGRITDNDGVLPNSYSSCCNYDPEPNTLPSWFSW
jgi:prepilin-type N-terminal cleavage/methylation domain-containing protein